MTVSRDADIVAMDDADFVKSASKLVDAGMRYDYHETIAFGARTDVTHRDMFDAIVETLKSDSVKVIDDALVYDKGRLQSSTQAVLSRQAAVLFVQYFVACGMFLDGHTVQAKLGNLQSIIERRYWDSMLQDDAADPPGESAKYRDKDSTLLPTTPHRKLVTGYTNVVAALRKIKTDLVSAPSSAPLKGGDTVTDGPTAVLESYCDAVRAILSQPVIVKFSALSDAELSNVLTKITADDGWRTVFNENSGDGKVKMVTLLTRVFFVDMNVAWETAMKTRLVDILSTEQEIESLMDPGGTDADQVTYGAWLRVASYLSPPPRVMYIQRYLAILDAIGLHYKDETHDRMLPVLQKMCAGVRAAIPYLQRTQDFLTRLRQAPGLSLRLDELLNAALSDPARGILTYVKIRYDDLGNGQWAHNDRFKFLHNEKTHAMRVFYTDTDDAIYERRDGGKPVRVWPAKPEEFDIKERSHEDPPSFTHDEVNNAQKKDVKLYDKQWAVGPFTDVFAPQLTNASIANRLLGEEGKPSPIRDALLAVEPSPVFVIGYGASGAGKTSTLIYYNKAQTNGILIDLCNSIGKEETNITMTAVEFFAVPESTEFADSASLEFVERLHNEGAQFSRVIRRTSPKLVFEYKRGSYVLSDETPYKNRHHSRVKTVLAQQQTSFDTEMTATQKTDENRPFTMDDGHTTTFPKDALLGRVIVHMIDTDRYVMATTNNPNSSRSHVLVFLKFGDDDRRQLIIGDFAGVENRFQCDDPKVLARFDGIRQDTPGNKIGRKFYDVFSTGLSKDELKGGAIQGTGKSLDRDQCPPFWPLDPVSSWPDGWQRGAIDPAIVADRDVIPLRGVFAGVIDKKTSAVPPDAAVSVANHVANHITYNFVTLDGNVTWKGDTPSMQSLLKTLDIKMSADEDAYASTLKTLIEMYDNYMKMQDTMQSILNHKNTTWKSSGQRSMYLRLDDKTRGSYDRGSYEGPTLPEIRTAVLRSHAQLKTKTDINNNVTALRTSLEHLQTVGVMLCDFYLNETNVGKNLSKRDEFVFYLVGDGETLTKDSVSHIAPRLDVELPLPNGTYTVIGNDWFDAVTRQLRATTKNRVAKVSNNWTPTDTQFKFLAKTIVCPSIFLRAFGRFESSPALDLILGGASVPIDHKPPSDIMSSLASLSSPDALAVAKLTRDGVSLNSDIWKNVLERLNNDSKLNAVELPRRDVSAVLVPEPGITLPFKEWSGSFTRYLNSVKDVPAFAEGLTNAVIDHCKYYWDTHLKLEEACRRRTLEGDYINHSLRQVRLAITALLLEKNRGRPSVTPPFIDSCLPQYCTDSKGCFTDASEDHAPESRAEVQTLMDEIRRQLPKDFAMRDVRLALLCVVNASRFANEPLYTPYVDASQLKRAFYAGDDDAASTALVELYTNIQERVNKKSPPAKLEYKQLLADLSPFITFDRSNIPIAAKYHEISSKYATLMGIIDAWNGPSTIGTLEFTDALSKFARVTTMCKADTINLPGNWTDHLAAAPLRKK